MPDPQELPPGFLPASQLPPGFLPPGAAGPDAGNPLEPIERGVASFYQNSPLGAAVALGRGTLNAVAHPQETMFGVKPLAETGRDLLKAQWDQAIQAAQKAKEAAGGGGMLSVTEAIGHGLAALLPILGPAAANVGEKYAQGDVAGGVGGTLGLLTPSAVKALKDARAAAPDVAPGGGSGGAVDPLSGLPTTVGRLIVSKGLKAKFGIPASIGNKVASWIFPDKDVPAERPVVPPPPVRWAQEPAGPAPVAPPPIVYRNTPVEPTAPTVAPPPVRWPQEAAAATPTQAPPIVYRNTPVEPPARPVAAPPVRWPDEPAAPTPTQAPPIVYRNTVVEPPTRVVAAPPIRWPEGQAPPSGGAVGDFLPGQVASATKAATKALASQMKAATQTLVDGGVKATQAAGLVNRWVAAGYADLTRAAEMYLKD